MFDLSIFDSALAWVPRQGIGRVYIYLYACGGLAAQNPGNLEREVIAMKLFFFV